MQMLEIMKSRMPEGLEIVKVKNKTNASQIQIWFSYDGMECVGWLPKTCTPKMENRVCDRTIFNAMAEFAMGKGDIAGAKEWLSKGIIHDDED